MDGRGGCCIARYAAGAYDMSKVDRIMLRYRPIAPKPVAGSSGCGGSSPESGDSFCRGGRAKRKYVRDNSNNNKRCNKKRKPSPERKEPVVTLPLLPETPDPNDTPVKGLTVTPTKEVRNNVNVPMWLSFEKFDPGKINPAAVPFWFPGATEFPVQTAPAKSFSASCVTVECVTETWTDGDGLGSTDEERRENLAKDTCPGFISDGYGRVTWTNGPYRKMVGQEGEQGDRNPVWLVMKENAGMTMRAVLQYPSFTCCLRVQYTCGKERSSLTVPCDVWKMESGGFAWRLDVKAALSLSLGC